MNYDQLLTILLVTILIAGIVTGFALLLVRQSIREYFQQKRQYLLSMIHSSVPESESDELLQKEN